MTTSDMTDHMADEPANVTPLHGGENVPGFRSPPHNFEAEMALLGAILVNNRSFERVQEFLFADHFADPAHARVYEACAHLIERGQIADPVTLKNYFKDDEDLKAIGGQAYIAELANAVITIQNAGDLGKEVYDCFLRRELIDIGENVVNNAFEYELEAPAPLQIERAEEMLFQLAEQGSTETGFQDFKTAVTGAIDMAAAAHIKHGSRVVYRCRPG